MADIAQKSIGLLLDELITTTIKLHHFSVSPSNEQAVAAIKSRRADLISAIERRAEPGGKLLDAAQAPTAISQGGVGNLIADLTDTLIRCWNAQELVMGSDDPAVVAPAAKSAQELNAKRNRLMQAIDQRLGQGSITVTDKTYGAK